MRSIAEFIWAVVDTLIDIGYSIRYLDPDDVAVTIIVAFFTVICFAWLAGQ